MHIFSQYYVLKLCVCTHTDTQVSGSLDPLTGLCFYLCWVLPGNEVTQQPGPGIDMQTSRTGRRALSLICMSIPDSP